MYKLLSKLWIVIFSNFFLIVFIKRILEFISIDIYLFQILYIVSGLFGTCCIFKIKNKKIIDIVIVTYILYITLNALSFNYPHHWQYVYKAFIFQYTPIFCYFIGRTQIISTEYIIEKMRFPILFCMIAGLYFYFATPSWYIVMKESQLNDYASETYRQEIYRLSSFWGHPYYIGYATTIYVIYIFYRLKYFNYNATKSIVKYKDIFIAILCITVLILAQLRITIFCSIIIYVYYNLNNKYLFGSIIKILLSLSLLAGLSLYLFQQISPETSSYIMEHITVLFNTEMYGNRFDATSGGLDLDTIFGYGFGRYDATARGFGKFALLDNEYQNHLAELGYIGLFLLIIIFAYTLCKVFIYGYQNKLESALFLFFILAAVGASVLSNETQYNYILWFVIGNLCSLPTKKCINLH